MNSAALPQSQRSSACTRFTWMSFMVAFRSPTRKKKKSTLSSSLLSSLLQHESNARAVWAGLVGHLSSGSSFVQTIWQKSCYRLHLRRWAGGGTRASVGQRRRQLGEQRIRRGRGHPRYRWVDVCVCILRPMVVGGLPVERLTFHSCSLTVRTDVEVDVDELNQEQVLDINKMASSYGMAEGDFVR